MRTLLFFFGLIFITLAAEGHNIAFSAALVDTVPADSVYSVQKENFEMEGDVISSEPEVKHKKLKAVILAITLGHFGVHRIYLGTNPEIPVVYSLTLGGGLGLLPLIDAIAIIFTKDLSKFENNSRVFMWIK